MRVEFRVVGGDAKELRTFAGSYLRALDRDARWVIDSMDVEPVQVVDGRVRWEATVCAVDGAEESADVASMMLRGL